MDKALLQQALDELNAIVSSDWRTWQELASPPEFERWVKSRCNHLALRIQAAIAQPVAATASALAVIQYVESKA